MLSRIPADQIYLGDYGWHIGRFHFSFADYQDPDNPSFGDLLTFNDFTLQPGTGFETHPHEEVEIISYCVSGTLLHEDDMGNLAELRRGEMQYTCAGYGIHHSERNDSSDEPLRFIQIWIRPNAAKLVPSYRSAHYKLIDRQNRLLQLVSGQALVNVVRINQDANIYVSEINGGRQIAIRQAPGRQIYLACLEGSLAINGISLGAGDAMKIRDEQALTIKAEEEGHLVMIEMPGVQ